MAVADFLSSIYSKGWQTVSVKRRQLTFLPLQMVFTETTQLRHSMKGAIANRQKNEHAFVLKAKCICQKGDGPDLAHGL